MTSLIVVVQLKRLMLPLSDQWDGRDRQQQREHEFSLDSEERACKGVRDIRYFTGGESWRGCSLTKKVLPIPLPERACAMLAYS